MILIPKATPSETIYPFHLFFLLKTFSFYQEGRLDTYDGRFSYPKATPWNLWPYDSRHFALGTLRVYIKFNQENHICIFCYLRTLL